MAYVLQTVRLLRILNLVRCEERHRDGPGAVMNLSLTVGNP
jgi:hypothetical protein